MKTLPHIIRNGWILYLSITGVMTFGNCHLMDRGLQEAGDAPGINHSGSSQPTGEKMTSGGEVNLERGFSYETIRDLMQVGHKIRYKPGIYGGCQAIMWDEQNKVYHGASESRKDGQAAGY